MARATRGKRNDVGVVAAAQRIDLTNKAAAHRAAAVAQPWQAEAWEAYNEVPEIGESLTYRADLISQLVLFPAVADPENPDGDPIPLADEKVAAPDAVIEAAMAELGRLRSETGGQAEILRLYEINMQVAGELYLVGFEETTDDAEYWQVCSTQEVKEQDGEFTVLAKPGDTEGRKLTEGDYIERYWTRHPQWSALPDSPLRRLRTDTRAAITLNEQVITEALSTLPAGLLLVPNEITFQWPAGYEPSDADAERDPFDVMLEHAIQDGMVPGSFASQYPLTVRGAAEYLAGIRRLSLARESDTSTETRLAARVERIARGLPLPVEKVMGHQQTTFANAKQVDQDEFDDYLRPGAVSMVTALTYCFYAPHLAENASIPEDWQGRIVLWFDPQALIADPDPEESADFGVAEGLVKAASWRNKRGWTEEDAPDAAELLARMAYRRGTIDPALAAQLLRDLAAEAGIELSVAETQTIAESTPQQAAALLIQWEYARARGEPPPHLTPRQPLALTAGAPTAPRVIEGGRELLAIDQELRTRWRAAMDAALERELERTANKLRNTARKLGVLGAVQARPEDVAPLLGRAVVAAAGVEYDWSRLRLSFMGLGRRAQDQAVDAAGRIAGGFSTAQRQTLKLRQADDLGTAWKWIQQAMTNLADIRLYDPASGQYTGVGESDPTSFIPAGMVRQAVNIAGGSPANILTDETVRNGEAWLSVGDHVEGVGVGERIQGALASEGVEVVSYRWIYGPALRLHPFEPHQRLDGLRFDSFDDEALTNTTGWPVRSHYLPGDHGGCVCDVEPILGAPPTPPEDTPTPAPEGKENGKPTRGLDTPAEQRLARHFAGWQRLRDVDREAMEELNRVYNDTRRLSPGSVKEAAKLGGRTGVTQVSNFKVLKLTKSRTRELLVTTPENLLPSITDDLLTRPGTVQNAADFGLPVVAKVGGRDVVVFGQEYLEAALERGLPRGEYPEVLYWNHPDIKLGSDLPRLFHGDDTAPIRQAMAREAKAAAALLPKPAPQAAGKLTHNGTAQGASKALNARWGAGSGQGTYLKADIGSLDDKVAADIADEIDRLMQMHPQTAKFMRRVGPPTRDGSAMSANTYADASTTGEMRFNPKWFGPTGQLDTMRNPHTTDYGWKVEIPNAAVDGISKARSTTTHEFGHMIDNVAKARLGRPEPHYAELMQIILDVVEPNLKGRHTAGAARLIQDKWGRQIALNARIKALVSRELSEYGATNLHEVVAESTSEALNSSSPRPLAKAVYEWVRARAEGAR